MIFTFFPGKASLNIPASIRRHSDDPGSPAYFWRLFGSAAIAAKRARSCGRDLDGDPLAHAASVT
jgi:hypothetical protein